MSRPVITLTTDFGQADGYVGTMKGVILGICPEATVVDISHEIRPQAVRQAVYLLETVAPYFPPGTVHLVVVDPGVGSARRPIAVQARKAIFVAPDNGVLSQVLAHDPAHFAVHLTVERYRLTKVSKTFHGRDIFAPAAAYLACGVDPREMGDLIPLTELLTLSLLHPRPQSDGSWLGEVIHVDRFGNLVTNFRLPATRSGIAIRVGSGQLAGLSRTFSDVSRGELVAYVGSGGYLEIAVREGRAVDQLGVQVGDLVRVEGLDPGVSERCP